ncbi:MAG: hypothetical protein COZ70_07350 [Deltaproteobacteria bacterium CG_4_8_14_3_um_filter_51_11]|nr:MAG: hypothetical protein COZ70_07350 [Deltaproteobacteria bacterium CG_4_8_14_3_um_filter_51_11]PIY26190.1 MAG: hypothetical protein COZ11_03320 [Deltaproteobacteria bacterium CG_4_10_14_3_um_filter_51_14]
MTKTEKTRLTLDVTSEENGLLEKIAHERGMTKSAILRESLGFMSVVMSARRNAQKVCIVDEKNNSMREVILGR